MKKILYYLTVVTIELAIMSGTFVGTYVKANTVSKKISVKIKNVDKKTITFKMKNKTEKRLFSGPAARLFIYKKNKWKEIVFYMPRTIELKAKKVLVYACMWSELVDKNYLNKKKKLKKGKYKLLIYNKTFRFKIK